METRPGNTWCVQLANWRTLQNTQRKYEMDSLASCVTTFWGILALELDNKGKPQFDDPYRFFHA
eukprot:3329031-Ditylum_brightwellii.AAC.2